MRNNIAKKNTINILLIFLAGIFLRLLFAPFCYHPDFFFTHGIPYKFASEFLLDPNTFFAFKYPDLIKVGGAYYGGLLYYLLGFFQLIIKTIYVPFNTLMQFILQTTEQGMPGYIKILLFLPIKKYSFFICIFLLKSIHLIFDFLSLFFLSKLIEKKDTKKLLILWLLNPIIIFVTYIFGGFDIIPTFFVILCLYCLKTNKLNLAFICMGIGFSIKKFPILFFLPTIIIYSKSFKDILKYSFLFICPHIITYIPYNYQSLFLNQNNSDSLIVQSSVLRLLGFSEKHGINIEKVSKDIIFIGLYLYYNFYLFKQKIKDTIPDNFKTIICSYTIIILALYCCVTTNIHYFLWLTPYIILSSILIENINKKYLALIIIFVIYRVKFRTGLWPFAPAFSVDIYNMPTLREFLRPYIDWRLFTKFMRIIYIMLSVNLISILTKSTFKKQPSLKSLQ